MLMGSSVEPKLYAMYLWHWKNSQNVYEKIGGQVSFGYSHRIINQLTPSKYSRRRGNETSAELEDNMNYVEDVGECAKNTSNNLQWSVKVEALLLVINGGNEKEQGVQRHCYYTRQHKYLVPFLKKGPLWVENFVIGTSCLLLIWPLGCCRSSTTP